MARKRKSLPIVKEYVLRRKRCPIHGPMTMVARYEYNRGKRPARREFCRECQHVVRQSIAL